MDALTFGTKVLLRGLNTKKEPVTEVTFDRMLEGLDLPYDQFVDLCILCGCDYSDTVDGVIKEKKELFRTNIWVRIELIRSLLNLF